MAQSPPYTKSTYIPGAREALFIAPDIVKLDRSLYKYICEPEMPIVEPKEQEDAG